MKLSYKSACRIGVVFNSVMATGLLVSAPTLTKGFFNPPKMDISRDLGVHQYTQVEIDRQTRAWETDFLFADDLAKHFHGLHNSRRETTWVLVRNDAYMESSAKFRATHSIKSL